MNKRQEKKNFRKYVNSFPTGRRSKAKIWLKKRDRFMDAYLSTDEIPKRWLNSMKIKFMQL